MKIDDILDALSLINYSVPDYSSFRKRGLDEDEAEETVNLAIEQAFDLLERMRWIPVSERLPNVEDADCMGFVICAWEDGAVETFSSQNINEWNQAHPQDKIIAWMPTPVFSKEML